MERLKRGNLRVDEINKIKRRKKKYILIAASLALLIVLAAIFLISNKRKNYVAFRSAATRELVAGETSTILAYKNGILKITRDGAETISADGKQIWNVAYNMKEPIADVNGNSVVIGDRGGKTVCIINGSGISNQINTLYPIVEVQVAAQSVAAVLMDNGTKDCISLYGLENTNELVYIETISAQDGFPISISLSEDGTKLVTSYIRINNDTISSVVTFYNFGSVGSNYIDKLVGSWSYNEFIPKVEFITNNFVGVFLENGITLYRMDETPEEIMKDVYDKEIKDIFYTSEYIGIVLENESGASANQMVLYSTSGKKITECSLDFSYDKIAAGKEYIVFYDNLSSTVLNLKGKLVFKDTFSTAVNYLLTGRSSIEFLAVTDIGFDILEMIETKEK